jgi:FkbM family methyltransferase
MLKDLTKAAKAIIPSSLVKAIVPQSVRLARHVRLVLEGSLSDPEVALLPLLAGSGCFLDVGANLGSWTGPASRVFNRVHAFEPYAELAAALRAVAPPNVTVHDVALSDCAGIARFAVPLHRGEHLTSRASLDANANDGFERVIRHVTMARLDSLELHGVDAIKIDVEGHEEATLEGAWVTIERERPTLIIEIEERHHAGRSELIIERILSRGYQCCYLSEGRIERFESGQVARLQPVDSTPARLEKAAGDINNFIFVPNERDALLDAMQRHLEE